MASSLIKINEATVLELQALNLIGPAQADRIQRYRQQVSALGGPRELAAAAGIGLTQAHRLAREIDWSNDVRVDPVNLLFSMFAAAACILLFVNGVSEVDFDQARPAVTMYNTSLLLILLGGLAVVAGLVARMFTPIDPGSGRFSAVALITGLILLGSLVIAMLLAGHDDAFHRQVVSTWKFAVFVGVIILLLYGPGWHVKSTLRHFNLGALLFDHGQVALALTCLLLIIRFDSPRVTEEFFCLWAGITLLVNAREMIRGRSSYANTLSETELATVRFLVREEGIASHDSAPGRLLRPTGWLLAVSAVSLLVIATGSLLME